MLRSAPATEVLSPGAAKRDSRCARAHRGARRQQYDAGATPRRFAAGVSFRRVTLKRVVLHESYTTTRYRRPTRGRGANQATGHRRRGRRGCRKALGPCPMTGGGRRDLENRNRCRLSLQKSAHDFRRSKINITSKRSARALRALSPCRAVEAREAPRRPRKYPPHARSGLE